MFSWILFYIFCLIGVVISLVGLVKMDFRRVGFGILWSVLAYGMLGRDNLHTRASFQSEDIKSITVAGVELPDDAAEQIALEGLRKYHPDWDDSRGGFPVFICRLVITHEDGTQDFFRLLCLPNDPDINVAPLESEDDNINMPGDEGVVPGLLPVLKKVQAKLPYPDSKTEVIQIPDGDSISYYPDTVHRTKYGFSVFIHYPSDKKMAVLAKFKSNGKVRVYSGWHLGDLDPYRKEYRAASDFPPLLQLFEELQDTESNG